VHYHTPRSTVSAGDSLGSIVAYNAPYSEFMLSIWDPTSQVGQGLSYGWSSAPSTYDVSAALEGWQIEDDADAPGSTTFSNIAFSNYGVPVSFSLNGFVDPSAPLTNLNVIIPNPTTVTLQTANT